jgi:hypothetical protein
MSPFLDFDNDLSNMLSFSKVFEGLWSVLKSKGPVEQWLEVDSLFLQKPGQIVKIVSGSA